MKLSTLLAGAAVQQLHAQTDLAPIFSWQGEVQVSTSTLTIREGEAVTYKVRLSEQPVSDGWWLFVQVDGLVYADGRLEKEGISWVPSVGWELNRASDPGPTQWRDVRIAAFQDDDHEDEFVTFTHEVWDENTNCPSFLHAVAPITVRVIDDDGGGALPELRIGDAEVTEGGLAAFEVTLSAGATGPVTVSYATADGTAAAGTDYTSTDGALTFEAGERTKRVEVQTLEDDEQEETETFTVGLSGASSGATVADGTGNGTIVDDDDDGGGALPELRIGDAEVTEGGLAAFEVTLSAGATGPVTVSYATADGTAAAGTDYTSTDGALTFEAGERTKRVEVQTLEDDEQEETETFTVGLSGASSGATVADGTGNGTIVDDDDDGGGALPELRIGDAEVTEGGLATFEVTLSAGATGPVTVSYATADGTAAAGTDYTSTDGALTFEAGERTKRVEVQTLEDDEQEETETFTVGLSGASSGATVADGTGNGTIVDDDDDGGGALPELRIGDAEVTEGGLAAFEVTLSAGATGPVTVSYATADGTAAAGTDYTSTDGALTFEAGERTKRVEVQTLEDDEQEETETFTVGLSGASSGATVADGTGNGTIVDDDDDGGGALPELRIGDAEVTEGGLAAFEVTLSAGATGPVTVSYATADGTAAAGTDYTSTDGALTFEAGERTKRVEVQTLEDDEQEETETFTVGLSGASSGATVADGTGNGTIVDDDDDGGGALPELRIGDAEVTEGGLATFEVTLSAGATGPVTVSYATADGTAAADLDYTAVQGTLRFEPRETTHSLAVATLTDELLEGVERFTVELSSAEGATVAGGTGTGTITDDIERSIGAVHRAVLPEMGRAMAFTPNCRIEQAFLSPAGQGTRDKGTASLSLSPALTSARRTAAGTEPLTVEQALDDMLFLISSQEEEDSGGRFAAWGCGNHRSLSGGDNGAVPWNGEVFSAHLGADVRLGSEVLVGLAVSRSSGSFDYETGGGGGVYEPRLTGVHPYLVWSVSPDLNVWGTFGHSWGELEFTNDLAGGVHTSPSTLNSGMVGVNGHLLTYGGPSVRLKGELAIARMDVAAELGAAFDAVAVDMQRFRLASEVSDEYVFSSGQSLSPWGELGVRFDGGDGETGAGLEVLGGLRYRNSTAGLTAEVQARRLARHEGAIEEWGFGGWLLFDPGVSDRGPSVGLAPAWGRTLSGVQHLWERGSPDPTLHDMPGTRLDAHFRYGFGVPRSRGTLTPYVSVSLGHDVARGYRVGSLLAVDRAVDVSLEVERRDHTVAPSSYGVAVRGTIRL